MTADEMIKELNEQLMERQVLIDLQQEQIDELLQERCVLKAQVAGLLTDRRFPDLAVG